MSGFTARYPTTCPRCDRSISVGDPVVITSSKVVIHVGCASGQDDQ